MTSQILIIDDDKMICDMLCQKIGKMGHKAQWVATLNDAFALVQRESFDVIYLDVHLPDGNGLDAIDLLRDSPSEPEIIIITGAAGADGAEMAIKSGAWDYVSKPSSMHDLMLTLERSLQYRAARKASTI